MDTYTVTVKRVTYLVYEVEEDGIAAAMVKYWEVDPVSSSGEDEVVAIELKESKK